MITYQTNGNETTVYLSDGRKTRKTGVIKYLLAEGAYKYYPTGDKIGGESFPTLRDCKDSLEEQ